MDVTESCSVDKNTLGSLRALKSEPYNKEFFEVDPNSRMYYQRHTILFNLYNFPGGVSMDPTNISKLTLTDCNFEYFHKDYEALIYAENNNMQIQNFTAFTNPEHSPNLMIFGDDRGVRITVVRSNFKHSKFSKGVIVYEALPNIMTQSVTRVIVLAREFWDRLPAETTENAATLKKKQASSILVSDSTFVNVAMGVTVNKLSYGSLNSTVYGASDVDYLYYDNYGAVLNARGFPGYIAFKRNTISETLIHLPNVKPKIFGS